MNLQVLGLILAGLFLGLTLAFILSVHLHKKRLYTHEKLLIKRTHEFLQMLKLVTNCQKEFEAYSQEPFFANLMDVADEMDQLNSQKDRLMQEYIKFRQAVRQIKQAKLWSIGTRWNIFQHRKLILQAQNLLLQFKQLQDLVTQLNNRFDEAREFPWSVALQARELLEYYQQAHKSIQNLATLGIQGDEISHNFKKLEGIQEDISRIPLYFLVDAHDQLLKAIEIKDLSQVVNITQTQIPAAMAIIREADKRKNQLLSLNLEINIAKKQIERFKDEIQVHPKEMNIDDVQREIDQWAADIAEIEGNVSEIQVSDLEKLSRKISDVIAHIQERQKQLQKERRMLAHFQNLLSQSLAMQAEIENMFQYPENLNDFRIQWDHHLLVYQQYQESFSDIASMTKPYSHTMLIEGVQKAQTVYSGLKQLHTQMKQIVQDFETLIEKREKFLKPDWGTLLAKSKEYEILFQEYHPRNFTYRDWVINYGRWRSELEQQYLPIHEEVTLKVIGVDEVAQLNEKLSSFLEAIEQFHNKTNQLLDNYYTIKDQEKQTTELLRNSRRDFAQITSLLTSHPLLREKAEKEIVLFDHQFDLRELEIQERQKDLVSRKLRRTVELVGSIEQAGNRWLKIIEKEAWSIADGLSERILEIEELVNVSDVALSRGKELVNQRENFLGKDPRDQKQYRMEQLLLEIKKRVDYWNECNSVSKQIIEQIELPVVGAYQECIGLRKEAEQRIKQLEGSLPNQRQWPPSSIELTNERRELQILKDKCEYLKAQSHPTIQIVRILSDLNGSYRALISKLIQYQQWVQQEQNRIQRIEEDILRFDRQWEIQANRYHYLPEIYQRIYDLRLKNQEELESVRQYWLTNISRKSSALDYDIVLKRLIEISRNFATAKIVIKTEDGKTESLDINGHLTLKQ